MKKTIVGKRLADYKDKNGVQQIGVELFYTGSAQEVEGVKTFNIFVKGPGEYYDIAKSLPLGSVVYIFTSTRFNREVFEGIEVIATSEPQEVKK